MNINFVLPSCGPKKLEALFLAKNGSFLLKMASRYDSEKKYAFLMIDIHLLNICEKFHENPLTLRRLKCILKLEILKR